jgi:hypothetical protein
VSVSPRTRPVGGSRQGAYNGQGEGEGPGCFWKGGLNKLWRGAIFLRIVVGEDEGIISKRDGGLFTVSRRTCMYIGQCIVKDWVQ